MVPNMSASLIPPLPYLLLDRLGDHGLLSLPIMDCALSVLLKISRRLCVYFRRYVFVLSAAKCREEKLRKEILEILKGKVW